MDPILVRLDSSPIPIGFRFFHEGPLVSKRTISTWLGQAVICCVEARRAGQMPKRSGVVPVTLYFVYRGIFVIWSYPRLLSIQTAPKGH